MLSSRLQFTALLTAIQLMSWPSLAWPDETAATQISQEETLSALPYTTATIEFKNQSLYAQLMNVAYQAYDEALVSLRWHSTYFPKTVEPQVSLQNDLLTTLSTQIRLNPHLFIATDAYTTLTTERGVLRGMISNPRNSDQHSKFIDFKQLYAMYRWGHYDFSAGKMLIDNGFAELSSVTDVFNEMNPVGYQEPIIVGTWHMRLDYYNTFQDQLSIIVLPFEVWDNMLPARNRYYGNVGGYANLMGQNPDLFRQISFQSNGYDDSTLHRWSWYGKFTGSRQQIDFFAGTYYGRSPYTVARIKARNNDAVSIIELEKPPALDFFAGLSHDFDQMRLYGESLLQWTPHNLDDHFAQFLAGIHIDNHVLAKHVHCEALTYIAELSFDKRLKKQDDATYYFSSEATRKNVNALSTQLTLKKNDQYSGYLGLNLNYKDHGLNYFIGMLYQHSQQLNAEASFNGYGGPSDSTLGRWKDNYNLQLSLHYILK